MAKVTCHIGVIGCGIAGLAASIGIARAGHTITLIEKRAQIGEVWPIFHVFPRILK